MAGTTTTIRVLRRTQRQLAHLAARQGTSISEFLDQLVERERRNGILADYNAHMAKLLADPRERAAWNRELAESEASADEVAGEDAEANPR
jgi:hypothetical protein